MSRRHVWDSLASGITLAAIACTLTGCVSFTAGPGGSVDGHGAAEVIRAIRGQAPAAPSSVVITTSGGIRAAGVVSWSTAEPPPEDVSGSMQVDNHVPGRTPRGHSTESNR